MLTKKPPSSPPDGLPPRPITIHKGDRCTVDFEGFGTVEITGPRRGELAGMVSALPLVLKALASVTGMLRKGTIPPTLIELETALAEAGIAPDPLDADATLNGPADRLANLLAHVATKLEALLTDRANFRTPRGMKDALQEAVATIRWTLTDAGYGALLPAANTVDSAA